MLRKKKMIKTSDSCLAMAFVVDDAQNKVCSMCAAEATYLSR